MPATCTILRKKCQDYYKFAFVRNPWGHRASRWHDKVIEEKHFQLLAREGNSVRELVHFAVDLDLDNADSHLGNLAPQ